MRVAWNGQVHTFTYALPDPKPSDIVQALRAKLQLPAEPKLGLFTAEGVWLDETDPVPDDEELIVRPIYLH